jgi:hypothetical protein
MYGTENFFPDLSFQGNTPGFSTIHADHGPAELIELSGHLHRDTPRGCVICLGPVERGPEVCTARPTGQTWIRFILSTASRHGINLIGYSSLELSHNLGTDDPEDFVKNNLSIDDILYAGEKPARIEMSVKSYAIPCWSRYWVHPLCLKEPH